ncbi:MAG: DUF1552 domain-containing protein [Verrucomicrobiota bacterium]
MPNGVNMEHWTPKGSKLGDLPRILKPLDELKEHVNVISGLNLPRGGHNTGTAGLLTGHEPYRTAQASKVNVFNPSLDQIIGSELRESTVFPTLELGMGTPAKGPTMNGNTNIYTSYISWKDATTPVPYEIDPQRAFDRLFQSVKGTNESAGPEQSYMPDASVLDAVLEDAKALEKKLGRDDRDKLDEYFTAVREVEDRIAQQKAVKGLKITDDVLKDILGLKSDVRKAMRGQKGGEYRVEPAIPQREYGRLMMDILALAFWSNSTRSATMSFGNGLAGGGNMSFLDGVNGSHHGISHHGYKRDKLEEFTIINTFYVEQYAYLLERLKTMKEGGSNVLDNSMVLFASNLTTGQAHTGNNIPVMLSGTAGGRIRTGRHIDAGGEQIGALHRSILDNMDLRADIGNGSGKLRGI